MTNEDILSLNSGKKFDIVLMNPPYGNTGGNTIHLKFADKCLDIANKQIVLMPITFVTKLHNKQADKYKEKFDKYLISVDEVDSKSFTGTKMPNVGVYEFDNNKTIDNIEINYLNTPQKNIKTLSEISEFSDYEYSIIKYLQNKGQQKIIKDFARLNDWKTQNRPLDEILHEKCNKYKDELNSHFGLIVNRANGKCNGTAFSKNTGNIFNKIGDYFNLFIKAPLAIGTNILLFDSKRAAENCKIALQNPLLRFTLYRLQDDQNMTTRVYSCVPDIDWSDDRVKTDEGLLELCGCPKNKCKEYAEYCKKIIDKVDNK